MEPLHVTELRLVLTQRELDVLTQMVEGHSNIDIGKVLFLSEKTVKGHAASAMRKLGANNRTQAVVTALRLGIVPLFPESEEEAG